MGVYGTGQAEWIEKQLAASDKSTILAGYVPLEKTGRGWYVVENREKIAQVMRKHKVLGFMPGHPPASKTRLRSMAPLTGLPGPVLGAYVPPVMRVKGFAF